MQLIFVHVVNSAHLRKLAFIEGFIVPQTKGRREREREGRGRERRKGFFCTCLIDGRPWFPKLQEEIESRLSNQCSMLSGRLWGEPSQSQRKRPIGFCHTVFHGSVDWSSDRSTNIGRKLALVGIIPNQILFSFSSDKDRRTDSRIGRKKHSAAPPGIEPRVLRILVARSNHWATKPQRELRVNSRLSPSCRNSQDPGFDSCRAALCFFVWSGCQFFYLCRSWKRREFDYQYWYLWTRKIVIFGNWSLTKISSFTVPNWSFSSLRKKDKLMILKQRATQARFELATVAPSKNESHER